MLRPLAVAMLVVAMLVLLRPLLRLLLPQHVLLRRRWPLLLRGSGCGGLVAASAGAEAWCFPGPPAGRHSWLRK